MKLLVHAKYIYGKEYKNLVKNTLMLLNLQNKTEWLEAFVSGKLDRYAKTPLEETLSFDESAKYFVKVFDILEIPYTILGDIDYE